MLQFHLVPIKTYRETVRAGEGGPKFEQKTFRQWACFKFSDFFFFFGSFQAGLISFFSPKASYFLILAKLKQHPYLRRVLINEHFPPLLSDYGSDVNMCIYYVF